MTESRPGREWNVDDAVSPRNLAEAGTFVQALVIHKIPLLREFQPPSSYEYQTHVYILTWSAGHRLAPLAQEHGVYFGNDLLTCEEGALATLRAIERMKQRAIETLGLSDTERAAQFFLDHSELNR